MKKKIGVAILGLGTVGSSVLKILKDNEEWIKAEYELEIVIRYAYVRNINKQRDLPLEGIIITDDAKEIANDNKVDVCIECMGGSGTENTFEILLKMIEKGKHIIMSSKKCLALHKNELVEYTLKYHTQLRYDATVGGGIPICKTLQNLSGYDSIHKIYGIANATTNYILSLMCEEGVDYKTAFTMAQKAGYAENDASEDVDGWDALYKMCILLRFGAGIEVDAAKMSPQNLGVIPNFSYQKNGNNIKQIFYAERKKDNKIEYYVGPVVVKPNEILGDVKGQNNIIFVEHEYGGLRAYYGKGAGGKETAAIMVEDLFDIINNKIFPKTAEKYETVMVENIVRKADV